MDSILHPIQVSELVDNWLKEDVPSFDYGGYVVGSDPQTAVVLLKSNLSEVLLAGCPFVQEIIRKLNCEIDFNFAEGSLLPEERPLVVARARGPGNKLLLAERILLNCLSRASGIASEARKYALKIRDSHTKIAGTRKTTPGFRMVEKYALLVGGADPHRYDLSSAVMLKDNHIWIAGSVEKAVKMARKVAGFSVKIEVECRSVKEAKEASKSGCDVVMLDNFGPNALHAAAIEVKQDYPNVLVESSGGITFENLHLYVGSNIDVLSTSKLVQGYPIVDFSMKIDISGKNPANPLVTMDTPH